MLLATQPTFNHKITLSGRLSTMSGQNHLSNRFLFDFFRSTRRRQILDISAAALDIFAAFRFLRKFRPKVSVSSSESFFKKVSFFSAQREKKIVRNRHKRHFFRFGRKKKFRDFLFNGEMTAGDLPEINFISKRIGTAPTASKLKC